MKETILSINSLSKSYGKINALDNLSFEVHKGEIFGLLGPNGSGKTTTLGILLGIILKNSGNFTWFGENPKPATRKHIGALLESPLFYPYLNAINNLKIIVDIKGGSYSQIDELLKLTRLYDRRHSKFKTFSLGMKQRLAVAAALINQPKVLILDEPTNGLDPQGIADIRELILKIASEGITIIFASHILDEVEKICNHVCVLNKGKKLYAGSVEKVLHSLSVLELGYNDLVKLQKSIKNFDWYSSSTQNNEKLIVKLSKTVDTSTVNKQLAEMGIYLNYLSLQKKSLEKYFLELLSDDYV